VYPPSSFGIRANEQNVQVFRRTQMLVGLMCWFRGKEDAIAVPALVRHVGEPPQAGEVTGGVENAGVCRREPSALENLPGDGAKGGVAQPAGIDGRRHAISLRERN
jgi:hypothetical protein